MLGQAISPILVGNNVWYINPSEEVWQKTAESGLTLIRIGGHRYDVEMPSKETLLDWVNRIQGMNAEPMLQVSQYQTPKQAAEIVKFFNIEKNGNKAPIKFWNIGNEPWLQNGRKPFDSVGAFVETYFKPIAAAMKEVDPSIKIYGPDVCDYIDEIYNDLFGGKNDITGKIPGKGYYYCDGLSWHRYPQGDGNPATDGYIDIFERIVKAKAKTDFVNEKHHRTGDDKLIWGIGEYNSKGGEIVHTWENGQMFGAVLGAVMKYEGLYAATWSMFEHDGSRTGTDFSFLDGDNLTPRASYRHMEFIAKYFKGNYVDGISSHQGIICFGSKQDDAVSVLIMNRETSGELAYTLNLNNKSEIGDHVSLSLNTNVSKKIEGVIKAESSQLLIFDGSEIKMYSYSKADFLNGEAPSLRGVR